MSELAGSDDPRDLVPSSWDSVENAHVSIKCVARGDTAGSRERADERDDDPSSILVFKETKWMKNALRTRR